MNKIPLLTLAAFQFIGCFIANSQEMKTFYKIELNDNEMHNFKIEYYGKYNDSLIASFIIAKNNFDTFTYLQDGFYEINEPDFNTDGNTDLVVYFADLHSESYSYYLFNVVTKSYQFLSEYSTEKQVEVKKEGNKIFAKFKSILSEYDYEIEGKENVQYAINEITFNQDFKKLKETETLEHYFSSVTTVTQIYPKSILKYPLLDDSLPPITFSQEGKEFPILETHQTIKLKKEAFSITFTGQLDTKPFTAQGLGTRVMATFEQDSIPINILEKQLEEIDDFNGEWTMNSSSEDLNTEFSIYKMGHNDLFYNPKYKTLVQKSKMLNDEAILLELNIDHFYNYEIEKQLKCEDISMPIYLLFFTDKNRNLKVDTNEFWYITLEFE